uniref:Tryptophan synthase beta chain-like PALP domain-containing protein n=1 Tax=Salmo trutta TaxID=8032 RepID=A0A673XJT5_SALTR
MSNPEAFHINSLFLESIDFSKRAGTTVYLKMESSQPSGSFNICGIEHVSKGKHVQKVYNCNKAPPGFVIYGQYVRRWAAAVWPSSVETEGADCLNAAVKAGKIHYVVFKSIPFHSNNLQGNMNIISELVTDQQALQAVETFLDEECVLVELACGAVYCGVIQRLQGEGWLPVPLAGPLVMIVCGGSSANQRLKRKLDIS